MITRHPACALPRLLPLGSVGWITFLALSACATGSAAQRSGAAPAPASTAPAPGAPVTLAAAPSPATPSLTPPSTPAAPTPAVPSSASAQHGPARAQGSPASVPHANRAGEKTLPPCVPVRRTRPKHKHHKPKQAAAPQTPTPAEPPSQPRADGVVDAQVGEIGASLSSILGKEVKSPKGEDLGRVVDVLADAQGHVRVAIIDFGGFLGVGTRRIAVDWPLLRFDPDSRDKPLILSVDRKKLQSAPEYNTNRPRVLMPPAATDVPDAGQTKK